MAGVLAILALVLSAALLAGMIAVLVLLRKGEGPRYGASRAYDANRREAIRALTGETVDRVDVPQWYDARRRAAAPDDPLEGPYRDAVAEALRAVAPAESAIVVPALSTAELRRELEGRPDEDAQLVVGIVLLNPEPPGGDAKRVALPIQVLFPALERAGRADLVERFRGLKERALSPRPG